jgi:hypothetical protein
MTLEVRRIVTGHNEFGMGIIVSDEKLSAVSRGLGANISGCEADRYLPYRLRPAERI